MLRLLRKRGRKYKLSLTLLGIMLLSSCAKVNCNCPIYPIAGPKVAAELENADIEHFPNTWEWISRIDKLRQELEE